MSVTNSLIFAVGSTDTVLHLTQVSVFPGNGGVVQIDSEVIKYGYSSDLTLLQLTRGFAGSTAAAHSIGAQLTLLESSPYSPFNLPATTDPFLPPTSAVNTPLATLTADLVNHAVIINVDSSSSANVTLGRAASFGVLGDTAVTNTGNTVITGDLGVSPGSSITGFPPGTYTGTEHIADTAAANAHTDATTAATTLDATPVTTDISSTDLGGYTATPGHYDASSAGTWSAGNLTLNGAGVYIFTFDTSLTMPANASVVLTGGATADNVYFITGTTFTFGATCVVNGTILAGTSITFAANSVLNGRALTYGSSGTTVTFPSAGTVTVPPSQTWTLPTPTDPTKGRELIISVSGTGSQMVNGFVITPGHKREFVWDVLGQDWAS